MAIFGSIHVQGSISGSVLFIGVLLFIVFFDAFLDAFEALCVKYDVKVLIKKLYREFMIMGLVSFAIFIMLEAQTRFVNFFICLTPTSSHHITNN